MEIVGFEVVKIMVLFMIAIEGALLLQEKKDNKIETPKRDEESAHTSRREVHGTFQNPLGDAYRKNNKGLYTPVRPLGRGDDEEDDL